MREGRWTSDAFAGYVWESLGTADTLAPRMAGAAVDLVGCGARDAGLGQEG